MCMLTLLTVFEYIIFSKMTKMSSHTTWSLNNPNKSSKKDFENNSDALFNCSCLNL